jgi:cation:H+ antiporter
VLLDALLFAVGVGLLVGGAWLLVSGGSRIAALLGVAPVVIGLTVVAFGTSAPELFVCLVAALRGSADLTLGNVIGSNLANIGLILGLAALIMPVEVDRRLGRLEVPLLVVATALFAIQGWNLWYSRLDGALLTLLFLVFMVITVCSAAGRAADHAADQAAARAARSPAGVDRKAVAAAARLIESAAADRRGRALSISCLLVLLGIGGLTGGGQLIVDVSVRIATRLHVSEALIGLTLVAVGTSLPEMATTIIAAVRHQSGIALGNVVGSNLFNLLAVAGPVILIRPLTAEASLRSHQLPGLLLVTILLPLAIYRRRVLGRIWGAVLLLVYAGVMAWWMAAGV